MSLEELLKKLFPKPLVPQKRYLLAVLGCVYILFKGWAIYYEQPRIEKLIEDAKILGLFLLTDKDLDDLDPVNGIYGEIS